MASLIGERVITMSKNKIRFIRKDNSQLVSLIQKLRIANKLIWKKVAYELAKPRRMRIEVNLNKLDEYAKNGETVLVPGKVLGSGQISKKATVAAFAFSESAKQLIAQAGGKTISVEELFASNPEGKNVLILT